MKPLIVTNHALQQYMIRTGRKELNCIIELISLIKLSGRVTYDEARDKNFNVTRDFKGDTYHLWYDQTINDYLLAIVAKNGAIKTVLRKEIYAYKDLSGKIRNDMRGRSFKYDYESPKRKNRRRMR